MRSGVRRGTAGCAAIAAVLVVSSMAVSAAAASTVSFSNQCCFEMRIAGDDGVNRFNLTAAEGRIVVHDSAPGAAIDFHGPASRCTGEGTATLSCGRDFLVNPITVFVALGPGDGFDLGADGCAGGAAFALAGGSYSSAGQDEATVFGGPFPDQFASYGRSTVHGCGGADQLNATRGKSFGGAGPDFIGARGSASLFGASGTDQLIAADGGSASGGPDHDELYDIRGQSTLRGQRGNDLVGDPFCTHEDGTGDGRDRMLGGRGRDRLAAGCVSKPVKGRPGAQRLVPTEPDHLDGGRGSDLAQAGHQSTLRRIEEVSWLPRVIR